jgi:hypothetical protein
LAWESFLDPLSTIIGIVVGGFITFIASWFLQKQEFRNRRLDRARERVYGPLAWELKKIHEQVKDFVSPNRQVAERIRNEEYLEWMIESGDLRAQIAELYDRELTEYWENIRNLTRSIAKKLDDDLLRQVRSSFTPDQSLEVRDETLRDCHTKVDTIARGIASMALRNELRDTEGMENMRYSYEQLHRRVPTLEFSSLQDYWPRATTICQDERARAEETRKKLQDEIEKLQDALQKLLKPDC